MQLKQYIIPKISSLIAHKQASQLILYSQKTKKKSIYIKTSNVNKHTHLSLSDVIFEYL